MKLSNEFVVSPSATITFFCKNCHETDWRHLAPDKKCPFEFSFFEYSPRAQIVKEMCEHKFLYSPITPRLKDELAAYAKSLFEELERRGVPE